MQACNRTCGGAPPGRNGRRRGGKMGFAFTAEQRMLSESVAKLMARVATPEYCRRLDRERLYPYELYDAWVAAGLFALPFSPEYGGLGASMADLAIVAAEIGRASADLAMAF